jgi:hypothetical protein
MTHSRDERKRGYVALVGAGVVGGLIAVGTHALDLRGWSGLWLSIPVEGVYVCAALMFIFRPWRVSP